MDQPDPPFGYRIEHRRAGECVVLERAPSYAAASDRILPLADQLRSLGAEGELALIEEAFGTVVARHPLWPADSPFEADHQLPADPAD